MPQENRVISLVLVLLVFSTEPEGIFIEIRYSVTPRTKHGFRCEWVQV